ncbi:MAG TPA: hypothetical protein VHV51_13685 [Polyangiaceae bacterium]|nr:hypothetical protein [Polyangiaceae bacterium]
MGPLSKRFSGPGLALLLGACGGAAATDAPAKTPHESHESTAAEDSADDDAPAEEESAPPRSACDDGSCSPCGTGMCLAGWYCDESASGGAACSWLPQCAQKSSCGCIDRALGSGCKCTEQGGGLHVECK